MVEGHRQYQHVQMPMCKFASFPLCLSSALLSAFAMPQLHKLDLHGLGWNPESFSPSIQQFNLQAVSLCFTSTLELQDILEMQPELEVLEIRAPVFISTLLETLPELLSTLLGPPKMNESDGLDHNDQITGRLGQVLPLCRKLKELKLTLVDNWEEVLELELELQQLECESLELEQKSNQTRRWAGLWEWTGRKSQVQQRKQVLVHRLKMARLEHEWERISDVRPVQQFMRQRMEKRCPLQRCQITWGSSQTDITNESVRLIIPQS